MMPIVMQTCKRPLKQLAVPGLSTTGHHSASQRERRRSAKYLQAGVFPETGGDLFTFMPA
jgi:hypothetical protein